MSFCIFFENKYVKAVTMQVVSNKNKILYILKITLLQVQTISYILWIIATICMIHDGFDQV